MSGKAQRALRQAAQRPQPSVPAMQAGLLPANMAGVTVQQNVQQQGILETRTYASPLMAPSDMERLNHMMPDGAQQYFDWVKAQTAHRQQLEMKALESQAATEKRGQVFGLIIALAFGAGAFAMGLRGDNMNLAIAFVSAPLVAIVAVFVTGRLITRNENVTKTKILAGQASNLEQKP